jgi:hypothetical protein
LYVGGYLLISLPFEAKAGTHKVDGIYNRLESNLYKATRVNGLYNTVGQISDFYVTFVLTTGNYVAKVNSTVGITTITIKPTDEVVFA